MSSSLPKKSYGNEISSSIDYQIEYIWDHTGARRIVLSGNYLFLQSTFNEVIFFENNQNRSIYHSNYSFYSLAASDRTLFLPFSCWDAEVHAVSFDNYSNPHIISKISHESTGGVGSIISYNHYVYVACFEWGFPIFDFQIPSEPQKVGEVSLPTWHSEYIYQASHYGLFIGDHNTGIFDLKTISSQPRKLWELNEGISVLGKFGVSSENFVVNRRIGVGKNMFIIIPRENSTVCAKPFNITFSHLNNLIFTHCAIFQDNVLVVSDNNNTLTLFEITESKELTNLGELYLGEGGSINDLYQINETNQFYIADGANGLLKLTLSVTIPEVTKIDMFNIGFNTIDIFSGIVVFTIITKHASRKPKA